MACVGATTLEVGFALLERGARRVVTAATVLSAGVGLWLTHHARRFDIAIPVVTIATMLAVAWIVHRKPQVHNVVLGGIALGGGIVAGASTVTAFRVVGGALCIAVVCFLVVRRRQADPS